MSVIIGCSVGGAALVCIIGLAVLWKKRGSRKSLLVEQHQPEESTEEDTMIQGNSSASQPLATLDPEPTDEVVTPTTDDSNFQGQNTREGGDKVSHVDTTVVPMIPAIPFVEVSQLTVANEMSQHEVPHVLTEHEVPHDMAHLEAP